MKNKICEVLQSSLIRIVTFDDLPLILEWRNSDRVRMVMNNKNIITWEEHVQWFSQVLQDGTKEVFIAECNQQPFGVVSFINKNISQGTCEWGFYVGAPQIDVPLGKALAILALDYIFKDYHLVRAEVLQTNSKSSLFHLDLGFNKLYEKGNYIYYKLTKYEWIKTRKNLLR